LGRGRSLNGLLTHNERQALDELRSLLAARCEPLRITLIGSKARGNSDAESDIDVVLVLRRLDSRLQTEVFEMCFDISLRNDVLLQPVLYSEKEFKSPLTRATPFYQAVIAEGIQL